MDEEGGNERLNKGFTEETDYARVYNSTL